MQDLSILRQYLRNIQETKQARTQNTGQNPSLTPWASMANTYRAMNAGKSPVEGLVDSSESQEFRKDFPDRIN